MSKTDTRAGRLHGVRSGSRPAAGVVWLLTAFLSVVPAAASAAQRTAISDGQALYPRVVRLAHDPLPMLRRMLVASVTSFPGGRGEEQIYASLGGARFTRIGTIDDADFASGLCCGTLYELPTRIGSMRAGTLLWAGSVGGDTPDRPMQIKIYTSTDRGRSWRYLSNCATATVNRSGGGLWEPQFAVAANGALVCFYSDETVPGFSQLIHQVQSNDGVTWSAPVKTIASGIQVDRPGMAVVSKLPSGRYFMTFELCGPAACTVFQKTSADGIDWGSASDVGRRVETADNQWFQHTPTNAWSPLAGSGNGRLYVIGQLLYRSGQIDPGNGKTMFVNTSVDGSGPWTAVPAPVEIDTPPTTSNFCQNYSSPLLPSLDGRMILGLASDFEDTAGGRECKTFSAVGTVAL